MGANVYANGMEVSGKATPHKVLASMPDVCLSPPSPPAGPIPIPYPNFAEAGDTTDGSKSVTIGGKEVNLKGKSKYKKSQGDEAATRSFGAGLISHTITGAVKHKAGSFDVQIEGAGVVRNLDLTTGNHSNPGDGCATVDAAGIAPPGPPLDDCKELGSKNKETRQRLAQDGNSKAAVDAGSGSSTVTHAHVSGPGGSSTVSAISRTLAQKYRNGLQPGLYDRSSASKAKLADNSSALCPDPAFKYEAMPHRRPQTHTESRILETLFAGGAPAPGTSVTLRINWQRQGERIKNYACPHCKRLLSHAQCACKLEIFLCTKNGREKKQPKCPPKT